MSEPLLNKSQIQKLISTPSLVLRWLVLWLCSIIFWLGIGVGIFCVVNSEILPTFTVATPLLLISIGGAWMAWNPTAEARRAGEISSVLSKSQILNLISSPSLLARWLVLWLCSVMFPISLATPLFFLPIVGAWMTWRPTAKLRRFGEISFLLSLVPCLLLVLVGFSADSGEGFGWNGAIFAFIGFAWLILSTAFLGFVEIACAGIPRRAQSQNEKAKPDSTG